MKASKNGRPVFQCGRPAALLVCATVLTASTWIWFEMRRAAPAPAQTHGAGNLQMHAPQVPPGAHHPAAATAKAASAVGPTATASNLVTQAVADGKDLASIRRWAHNELEVERMLKENDKIYRRQLVVLKETVAAVIERNRLSGEPIRRLVLPGLDGNEIAFEVKDADIAPSGLRGMFHGILAGRPDSMVTLAFLQNRQAYTILSPSDNLYLDAEPHDPGDVIVKSIHLEKYGAGLCGTK